MRPTIPRKQEGNVVFYPPWGTPIWAYHFVRVPASECQPGRKTIMTHTLFPKPGVRQNLRGREGQECSVLATVKEKRINDHDGV